MDHPVPEGWKGGSQDFTILRTFDGHLSLDRYSDEAYNADQSARRNDRSPSSADIGVEDYSGRGDIADSGDG